MFSETATVFCIECSYGTATGKGDTREEASLQASKLANDAAYFGLNPPTHPSPDTKTCNTCVLSCIDFRFVDDSGYYMDITGNCNNYDQFSLAGASLGYNGIKKYKNWILFADQTIQIAYDLHKISEVSIFDHLDCGAYRLVYSEKEMKGKGEYNLHVENLNKAEARLLKKYSFLTKVNKFIINTKYEVIQIH